MSPEQPRFAIVGAGLAGPLLACYLARAGYAVDLHEKRPDPRAGDPERGRSINLALSTRGLFALEQVGLKEEVVRHAVPMRGRIIHHPDGRLAFQPYGEEGLLVADLDLDAATGFLASRLRQEEALA